MRDKVQRLWYALLRLPYRLHLLTPDSHWNYRVIRNKYPDGDYYMYAIHSVYYTKGKPTSWSEEPADISTYEDLAWLRFDLKMGLRSLKRPMLEVVGDKLVEVKE